MMTRHEASMRGGKGVRALNLKTKGADVMTLNSSELIGEVKPREWYAYVL